MNLLRRLYKLILFVAYYLFQLIKANLMMAKDILSPNPNFNPGIIKINLEVKTDQEILILVNLISMTPGSLCLHITEDKSAIYVHDMYLDDVEKVKHHIKEGLEKRILEFTR